jgi:hypothetical protein
MLFTEAESTLARAVGQLGAGNPFLPERLEAERTALGDAFEHIRFHPRLLEFAGHYHFAGSSSVRNPSRASLSPLKTVRYLDLARKLCARGGCQAGPTSPRLAQRRWAGYSAQ